MKSPRETKPRVEARSSQVAAQPRVSQLYLVFQCDGPLEPVTRFSLHGLQSVTIGGAEARTAERSKDGRTLKLELDDSWASSSHAELQLVLGRWILQDSNSRNGTFVNGRKTSRKPLADGDLIEIGHAFFLYRALVEVSGQHTQAFETASIPDQLSGLATIIPSMADRFRALERIAQSTVSVLIEGESGTGKELIARAVHDLSKREGEFIALNCAAIPPNLVESELFGYQRGAFTGAIQSRPGLVRSADRGTLFLDEIDDLSLPAQASFLRVLQERQVVPIGEAKPISVEIRLCSATNRNLTEGLAWRKIREDLFARISGFTIRLPPLRERKEDFGLILGSLLRRYAKGVAADIRFEPKAARALLRYEWPLNIRELEKCIETAVVLAQGGTIGLKHLSDRLKATEVQLRPESERKPARRQPVDEDQLRDQIIQLMKDNQGNLRGVARALGRDRTQLRRWLKRFQIDPRAFKKPI